MLRHAAGGIRQVIGVAPLREPGTFLIAYHHLFLAAVGPVGFHRFRAEGNRLVEAGDFLPAVREGDHVVPQAAVPAALVAPEEPGRAVIVDEDGRVDEREPGRERPADGVGVRPFRPVRDRHGEGVRPGRRLGQAHVPVPLPVPLHGLRGPGAVPLEGPRERGRGHGGAEIGPVDHVLRAVQQPVLHLEVHGIVLVVVHEQIHLVPVHIGRRVGREGGADDGILRQEGQESDESQGEREDPLHAVGYFYKYNK